MRKSINIAGSLLFSAALLLGCLSVAWMCAVFRDANPVALAVTMAIGGVFCLGVVELVKYRYATGTLVKLLSNADESVENVEEWLLPLDASLRNAVRLRAQGERVGLPAPVLTSYLVGLLVMLGLLGTFAGMVDTLKGAVLALEGATDLAAIRAGLAAPIQGLGLAFGTSVAGVSTSAMLGLMSALSRRDRVLATRSLDTVAATVFKRFSKADNQQRALDTLQVQTGELPAVARHLDAVAHRLERLEETLVSNQERLHASVSEVFKELAVSMDATHKRSLEENVRLACESIQPVVKGAMASVAEETKAVQNHLAETAREQLRQISEQLSETSKRAEQSFQTAMAEQNRTNDRLVEQMRATLGEFKAKFEQLAVTLGDSFEQTADALASQWRQEQSDSATRQEQTATSLKNTMAGVVEDVRAASGQLTDHMGKLLASSEDLVRTRIDTEARWLEGHGRRMEDLARTVQSELGALREDEQERGKAAVERIEHLEALLAGHLTTLGQALEAPMARLIKTASQAPRAAAEVIEHLRREESKRVENDTGRLEEQKRVLEQIDGLSRSLAKTSTEQYAAIEELTASARQVLQGAAARFDDRIGAGADRFSEIAENFAASAVDMASLGDSFGAAVALFGECNEQMAENLARIEESFEKAAARSDEQLGYYVAQARDVIDNCMLSQKEIVDDLQKLYGNSDIALTG